MSVAFAELQAVSHYSFLQSTAQPQALVEGAVALGYQAIAVTDECSLAGIVKAWQAGVQHGMKLISGSYFVSSQLPQRRFVVLCKNMQGYRQLSALITLCRQRADKGDYSFAVKDLCQHDLSECLLLCSGVQRDDLSWLSQLQADFEPNFYLLATRQLLIADHDATDTLTSLGHQLGCSIVASNQACMVSPEELPLLHTLFAIRQRTTIDACEGALAVNGECYMRSLQQLAQLFPRSWLHNTLRVAEQCVFDLGQLRYEYPGEVVPTGHTPQSYLTQAAWQGAASRFPQGVPATIREQLHKELALVHELRYEHFFLTIYDLILFATSQGILFQGRGSAANSVLCYCLGITAVNPAQSQLLFERFISKERDEPPDIDVDFEHQRREEVIQYIYKKYGRHRAALTATVITYRLRSAIRDVGKALGFPPAQLAHMLERLDRRDSEEDWQQQLMALGVLRHPRGKHLIQLVAQLKGAPRHLSQHVGGFVIAAERLSDLVPVENASMPERTVIQWDKNDIEALKLLKVDVLGLGMLSALRKGFAVVAQCYERHLEMAAIPQEDPAVYKMLQKADAMGVFQVESRAQMNMLPRLKPNTFYDLVVQIAIVRPGPIQGDMVHPYLRRRDGKEAVSYPNPAVQSVLERTLGVPIFQEQVIKLAMVAAGFTGGEADQLRRAMATWKSKGQMLEFKQKIVDGMLQRGYQKSFALRLFEQICGFGEYGFPESHAASFANLAYASAWLKCHYPLAFYIGLLNSLPMGFYSAAQLVQDAKAHDVTILPVCVNASEWQHQAEKVLDGWAIRLGMRLVKGLSQQAAETIVARRPATGYIELKAVQALHLPANEMEALASANAFKALAGHRYQARWQMTRLGEQLPLLEQAEAQQGDYQLAAPSDFADMAQDFNAIGLTLGDHPLTLLRTVLPTYKRAKQLASLRSGQLVTVIGLVVCRQRPSTSAGVTFLTLEDETGNTNVVIWKERGRQQRRQWLHAKLLEVKGTVEIEGDVVHVIAGRMLDLSHHLPGQAVKSRDFH